MTEILNWLQANSIFFIIGYDLLALVLITIGVFKKKVKMTSNILSDLLLNLPQFINDAELSGLSGERKFSIVFSRAVSYLVANSDLDTDAVIKKYGVILNDSIESILSTPKKKEVVANEKEII